MIKIKDIEYKKNKILELNILLKNKVTSLILIDSIFLKFNDLIYIRKVIIKKKSNLFMIKNSLFKRSIINTKFDILKDYINGSNIILYFSNDDNNFLIDILKDIYIFLNNKNLKNIKLVLTENKIFKNSKIDYLCNLSTYNDSIKKFLFILRNISIINLLKVFNYIKDIKNKEDNKCQLQKNKL